MKGRWSHIVVLALCSLFLTIAGCRPRGILHSGKMRDVLVDLHKTEALMVVHNYHHGYEEQRAYYYAEVLEKHGVTQAEFDSSLVWYTAHPKLFDKIYPKVMRQLHAEQDAFLAAHAEELQIRPRGKLDKQQAPTITQEQIDSINWVMLHGLPTLWNPMPDKEFSLIVDDATPHKPAEPDKAVEPEGKHTIEIPNEESYKSAPSRGLHPLRKDY